MKSSFAWSCLGVLAIGVAGWALPHAPGNGPANTNSFHLFTSALAISPEGVAKLPSNYRWSVETNNQYALEGQTTRRVSDGRVLIRLYNPEQNFTAVTAQIDLRTARDLHAQLGNVLESMSANPNYVFSPELYPGKTLPIAGEPVDENGFSAPH